MNTQEIVTAYPYKIELHAHTKPASPCSEMSPKELIERYARQGFHGVVLTNHFIDFLLKSDNPQTVSDTYLRDYYEAKAEGEKRHITVYLGMEVRFPENCNDYLVYGIEEEDVKTIFSHIHGDYATFYKEFKNDKNVIVQAHPFRDQMVLQNPDFLDGIEVFNMHPGHNSRIALASRYAAEHGEFIKTCGTDFHHDGHEGLAAMLSKTLPNDSVGIADLLKSRDYLFQFGDSIMIP